MYTSRLLTTGLFMLLGIAYLGWSWSSVLGGFGGDNANYLLMAQHFSPYSKQSIVAEYFASQSFYPPLFPLLLSISGGAESLLIAHLVTTSFLIAAFATCYWWMRRENIHHIVALAATLTLALIPGLYLQTLSVHSENLYLLCLLITLACISAIPQEKLSLIWMGWAIIALAATYLTRSVGLALIMAWLLWLWLNPIRHRLFFSLLALLPVAGWSLFNHEHSGGYWEQLQHGYYDPAGFLQQVWIQSSALLEGWQSNFGNMRIALIASNLLLLTGLVAAVWRTLQCRLDGFYVWCYLGIVIFWPFPAEAQRMAVVLIPVLLCQTLYVLHGWQARVPAIRPLQLGLIGILLLAVIPEFALNTKRYFTPLPSDVPENYKHVEGWYTPNLNAAAINVRFTSVLESSLANLGDTVPEDQCVLTIKPSVAAYLARRISKAPPQVETDHDTFERTLIATNCRYLYILAFASPSYPVKFYPYDRLQPRLEILDDATITGPDQAQHLIALLAKLKQ